MKNITIACALGALFATTAAEAHPRHGYGHGYAPPAPRHHYSPPARHYGHHRYAPPRSYAPVYGGSYSQRSYAQPVPAYRPYGYGPVHYPYGFNSAARGPASEGYNFGYAGGPTFGMGRRPVINGVQIFGPPDGE